MIKLLCIFSSFLFCLVPMTQEKNNVDVAKEKIIFESLNLKNALVDGDEIISEDTNCANVSVLLDYDKFTFPEYDESVYGDVDTYRKELFEAGKTYHSQKNQELCKSLDFSSYENVYVSKYSPFVDFNIENTALTRSTYSSLTELAKSDVIKEIVVRETELKSTAIADAIRGVGADSYVNAGTYSGDGIVIGMLEPSILDVSHANFANTDVEVRDEWYYVETVNEHSNIVGSILCGKDGIAKDAKLLSVEVYGNPSGEVEWMMDRNVNVINCSYGEANPTGKYSSDSAYMDFIVDTYKITIVASAGNEGEGNSYIGNPGLGYNVITVGACAAGSTSLYSFSSTVTVEGNTKPTLMAPGIYSISPFGLTEGTSIAAPVVSGCVALMMEANSDYKIHPEAVMASLVAYAQNAEENETAQSIVPGVGAGKLNMEHLLKYTSRMKFYPVKTGVRILKTVYLTTKANQKIKAGVANLAYATGSVSETKHTNLDLTLRNFSASVIQHTFNSKSVVEMLHYTIPDSNNYSLCVQQLDYAAARAENCCFVLVQDNVGTVL